MNSLYIFVNSERPDQYLNSLVYCALRRDVRKVEFIHIKGFAETTAGPKNLDGLSGRVMGAVQSQLEGLAERGEYSFRSGPRSGERILLKNEYKDSRAEEIKAYYKSFRDLAISYSNVELDYVDLRSRLRQIAKDGRQAYVDVTAIKKRYLGDVVAAGLVEGLGGLHTFDLLAEQPDFERPWRTLMHELEQPVPPAFQYANILDTPVYRECARLVVVRAPRLAASVITTVILLTAVALGDWRLGPQSPWTQAMFAVSAAASILSLISVFFTPRGNQ
jgi:hypothetical protein